MDAPEVDLVAKGIQAAYIDIQENHKGSLQYYHIFKQDPRSSQELAGIRDDFADLRRDCRLVLREQVRDAYLVNLPLSQHDHVSDPVIYMSTTLLQLLQSAISQEQQHHIINFAMISMFHVLGQLLGRRVSCARPCNICTLAYLGRQPAAARIAIYYTTMATMS